MPELLRATTLFHRFPNGNEALRGIDFYLDKGECLLLTGRNGSGKTLLVRHFLGLVDPTSGDVLFCGKPVRAALHEVRRSVGFVFQDSDAQILGQTVREDIEFGPANLRLSRDEIKNRTQEALAVARLTGMDERRPETLSGGEKKRLAIAGVLAMRPECLILDEPFANLDLDSIRDVLLLLHQLKSAGKTLFILTHELEKIIHLADRLVIMDKGCIVYDGSPSLRDPAVYASHGLLNPYSPPEWAIPEKAVPEGASTGAEKGPLSTA